MVDEAKEPAGILLIEDDDSLREIVAFNLGEAGHRVDAAADGEEGLERYDADRHDVVITDLRMPGIGGMEVLGRLRERDPAAVVVVFTAYGGAERALEAMRRGAFHYVEKPVNTRALLATVARAAEHRRLVRENAKLKAGSRGDEIITASPQMQEVFRIVDRVADSDASVLITGESGVGKELVARALHARSARAGGPFVTVNCAAIPDELLESMLFGHERGAFTGATRASPGKFLSADGGTIFLDEIGEMSPRLQSKLLRVLQEGEVDAVGAARPRAVDVRVLAATHQDLPSRIEEGAFREDLFYRLNVIPVVIPPLRERREDIPVLLRFFLRRHAPADAVEVDREVDELFMAYAWPGNVRELENVVKRMVLLRRGDVLTAEDVPAELRPDRRGRAPAASGGLPFELPEEGLDLVALERGIIEAALARHEGNQSATARYLNIPRHVLLYRLEKYGIGE